MKLLLLWWILKNDMSTINCSRLAHGKEILQNMVFMGVWEKRPGVDLNLVSVSHSILQANCSVTVENMMH